MALTSDYAPDVRQAYGLPRVKTLRSPVRESAAWLAVDAATGSTALRRLVSVAAAATGAGYAQVSLLTDRQIIVAVSDPLGGPDRDSRLEDALCSVAVLSGDVLVAADTRSHPWLRDLPSVTSGRVGAYLGVPLAVMDGTLVGALCLYATASRAWAPHEVSLACQVGDIVTAELREAMALTGAGRPPRRGTAAPDS